MINKDKMSLWALLVVRVGLSAVFLWFGIYQIMDPAPWGVLIPQAIISLSGLSATTLVLFNGWFEVVFGICLLLGFFTRLTALLLALHLFNITFVVGYNDVGVRDFGLAMATLSIFLRGSDALSLDARLEKKKYDQQRNF